METLGFDPIASITEHSKGFADVAEGNLTAPVRHCPGWTVADLVYHLTKVHAFWATIAAERLDEPPGDERAAPQAPDNELIEVFRSGAVRLTAVLAAANGSDPVWTWAPAQRDIDFITRHQVQEAAVHHWDAADAAGTSLALGAAESADAVGEFLTFSVSSEADPADPVRPPLDGSFGLRCTDDVAVWTVTDGSASGTVAFAAELDDGVASISGTASDLLLWLYGRVELDTSAVASELVGRFRALCYTD